VWLGGKYIFPLFGLSSNFKNMIENIRKPQKKTDTRILDEVSRFCKINFHRPECQTIFMKIIKPGRTSKDKN